MTKRQSEFIDWLLEILLLKNDSELADKMGIWRSTLSRYRTGKYQFGNAFFCAASELSGLTITQIKERVQWQRSGKKYPSENTATVAL